MQLHTRQIKGYIYGLIQPSVILKVSGHQNPPGEVIANLNLLLEYLSNRNEDIPIKSPNSALDLEEVLSGFFLAIINFQLLSEDKLFSAPQIIASDDADMATEVILPTLFPQLTTLVIDKVFKCVSDNLIKSFDVFTQLEKEIMNAARVLTLKGTNTGNFLDAALEQRIPFKILNPATVIYGYGKHSCVFQGSITNFESSTGVNIAKSKYLTNQLLGSSGLPVTQQRKFYGANQANQFVEKMGFPVVVKPEREDQGRGVYADIRSKTELNLILKNIGEKFGPKVIEKHVTGDVYRINTLGGKVIRVVKRIRAQVVGDGVSSIENLIEKFNKDPRRNSKQSSMGKIEIDYDLLNTLGKQKYDLNSIPKSDMKVSLRSISSVTLGGESIDFFHKFHADNFELCETIANILRLDITGIDLISKDASVSWKKGNTVILEVNASPQLGVSHMDIYEKILRDKIQTTTPVEVHVTNIHCLLENIYDQRRQRVRLELTPKYILQHGCPVQYFDKLTFDPSVDIIAQNKIRALMLSVKPTLKPID